MAEDYMQLYQKALTGLQTGGKKLEAALAEIEEGKKQAIGRGQQALVSGGMGGVTTMGAVPLQAEKIAARGRLGARGRAEETYLTTLASFAAFAQRGEEAQKQREFEAQQTQLGRGFAARQTELGRIEQREPKPGTALSPFDVFGRYKSGREPSPTGGGYAEQTPGGGYAQQFPSIYGQTGVAAPSLINGGGNGSAWERPDIGTGDPFWGASEQWRSEQPEWVTGATTEDQGVIRGPTTQLQPGQVSGVYGKATYGPTTAKESMAYSRWKKQNPGGSKQQWAMQYR